MTVRARTKGIKTLGVQAPANWLDLKWAAGSLRHVCLLQTRAMDQTRVDSTSPKVREAPPSDPPTTKTGARPTTQTAPAYPPCSTYYSPALVRGPPGRRRRWAGSSRSEVELPCVWLTERRPARSRLLVKKLSNGCFVASSRDIQQPLRSNPRFVSRRLEPWVWNPRIRLNRRIVR